jgi:hypothetical protein
MALIMRSLHRGIVIPVPSSCMEAPAEFGKGSFGERLPHGRHQGKIEEEIVDGVEPVR